MSLHINHLGHSIFDHPRFLQSSEGPKQLLNIQNTVSLNQKSSAKNTHHNVILSDNPMKISDENAVTLQGAEGIRILQI